MYIYIHIYIHVYIYIYVYIYRVCSDVQYQCDVDNSKFEKLNRRYLVMIPSDYAQ